MKALTANWKELRNTSGIYKFIFPNGKVYIGQSIDLYSRINSHISTSKQPLKSQVKLYRAIKHYGLDNIELEVLWCIEKPLDTTEISNKLDDLEIEYISFYNSLKDGYNSTLGGKGSACCEVSTEQKEIRKIRFTKPTRQEKIDLIYEYGIDKAAELLKIDVEVLEESIGTKDYSQTITSSQKRANTPIKNSKENPLVMELISKNYQYLKDRCIKKDIDEDYFNDTLLKMTYKYNVEENFNSAFIHQFNIVKMQYNLDKNVLNTSFDSYDDNPDLEYLYYVEQDEIVESTPKIINNEIESKYFDNDFIHKLKSKSKSNANFK